MCLVCATTQEKTPLQLPALSLQIATATGISPLFFFFLIGEFHSFFFFLKQHLSVFCPVSALLDVAGRQARLCVLL